MRGKKRERIIRVLLDHPKEPLSKYRIAKEAGCSRTWVIELLNNLEDKGLVKNNNIKDIKGLFDYWLNMGHMPFYRAYNVQNPFDLLKKTDMRYAITTYFAESFTQNYLFPSRLDFYIMEKDAEKWHDLFIRHGLVGKGNVKILIDDPHVFYMNKKRKGYRIVSIPQLILDLLREEGVAKEAAYMLMEKKYNVAI